MLAATPTVRRQHGACRALVTRQPGSRRGSQPQPAAFAASGDASRRPCKPRACAYRAVAGPPPRNS